jgi:hypothetical protein
VVGRPAMLIGYARTSTADQNAGLAAHKRDLKGAGCTKLAVQRAGQQPGEARQAESVAGVHP